MTSVRARCARFSLRHTMGRIAARISASTGVRVFSPEYRLAPEHPFPAALHDVLEVYRWLVDEVGSPSRVIVGGESSGGGLRPTQPFAGTPRPR